MEKNDIMSHEIVMASSEATTRNVLAKMKREGRIVKIATKIYTTNLHDTPENIVRRNLFFILGELYPGAVMSHRSAFECRPTPNGHIYLTYRYTKKVSLPGITVHLLEGPKALPCDHPFVGGLHISCSARAYLENLTTSYSHDGVSKCLGHEAIEEKLEKMVQANGENELNQLRDEARMIASDLHMHKALKKLDALIGAILSTKPSKILTSPAAQARALGEPFDSRRLELFGKLMAALNNRDFENYADPNESEAAYKNLAFFESYFSNYIEGTEFEVNDARQIVETLTPMPTRNADSHDVLGTYYIVSNRKEMAVTPSSPTHLFEILRHRHRIMMGARHEANPGIFKMQNNHAGETHFVDYRLVTGTLKKGFEIYCALRHPFARALFMLFMVSEVHPFADGNGRLSRIMMNAELIAAGQSKIIIPTVFRADYLGALRQLSRRDNPDTLIRALERVRLFSYHLRGESFEAMRAYLEQCNAFKDSDDYILQF
ncbi:MAG: Fic family protein [Muribaculaceae bacterium]|nr:Fic family protein [Muribaculaceae bacterium]